MADVALSFVLFFLAIVASSMVGCLLGNMIGSLLIKWFK